MRGAGAPPNQAGRAAADGSDMRIKNMVTALLLSGLLVPAWAAGQASIALGGFTAALTDLDPQDGHAAAIVWDAGLELGVTTWHQSQAGWFDAGVIHEHAHFWLPQWGATVTDGQSSSGPVLGGRSEALRYELAGAGAGPGSFELGVFGVDGVNRAVAGYFRQGFTIAPHTELTLTLNVDGMLTGAPTHGGFAAGHGGGPLVGGSLFVWFGLDNGVAATFDRRADSGFGSSAEPFALGTRGELLTLSLSNPGAAPVHYELTLAGQVELAQTLAPVPEPAQWALLSAGLLAAGAVARRNRKT